MQTWPVIIVGGGPAGLTAAYRLGRQGRAVVVCEADPRYVGGISRTVVHQGFRFDIGGHRFYSKYREIEDLWTELLPEDFLVRERRSRIFFRGRFFTYPLRPLEAALRLGWFETGACVLSFIRARLRRRRASPVSFKDWTRAAFGQRLSRLFFETYTEKVWGMPCDQISAAWASQRIQGLSLATVFMSAIRRKSRRGSRAQPIKSLIERFRYPRQGPGMLWQACANAIVRLGGSVRLGHRLVSARQDPKTGYWHCEFEREGGVREVLIGEHLLSSVPLSQMVEMIETGDTVENVEIGSSDARESRKSAHITRAMASSAARDLRYRDFIVVGLMLRDHHAFDDHWVYIHDPRVRVGRIQNFKAWSSEMVPDPRWSSYGFEYFCNEGDAVWKMSDDELSALARREGEILGLWPAGTVADAVVIRQRRAYPVYDETYAERVAVIRDYFEQNFARLQMIGRNGLHQYNNQDHAMITGMLAAENVLRDDRAFDLWSLEQDGESGTRAGGPSNVANARYLESGYAGASQLRMAPPPLRRAPA